MSDSDFAKMTIGARANARRADPSGFDARRHEHELRGLIAQASPGPWHQSHGAVTCAMAKDADGNLIPKPLEQRFLFIVERSEKGLNGTQADARFVCAANPKRVAALLDLIQTLVRERDEARAAARPMTDIVSDHPAVQASS